jgi:hypothetical protein
MAVDKIYTFLGISREGRAGLIIPDYTLPLAAAYTHVTKFFIEKRRDLRVLSAV